MFGCHIFGLSVNDQTGAELLQAEGRLKVVAALRPYGGSATGLSKRRLLHLRL